MWQRFDDEARTVVYRSQGICQKFNACAVEPQHLFFALLSLDCVATKALERMDLNIDDLAAVPVATGYARKNALGPKKRLSLSAESKRAIDAAYEESRKNGDNFIGTEHLLLGLAGINDAQIGAALASALPTGAKLADQFRAEVLSVRREAGLLPSQMFSFTPTLRFLVRLFRRK